MHGAGATSGALVSPRRVVLQLGSYLYGMRYSYGSVLAVLLIWELRYVSASLAYPGLKPSSTAPTP